MTYGVYPEVHQYVDCRLAQAPVHRPALQPLVVNKTPSAQTGKRKPPIPTYKAVRVLTHSLLMALERPGPVTVASNYRLASHQQAEAMQIPSVRHTVSSFGCVMGV